MLLSYFQGIDPAAAIIHNGKVLAYVEEERLIRFKHAANRFPIRSIESCLNIVGIELTDVDKIISGWDAPRYADGRMAAFYADVNTRFPPDAGTLGWQQGNLKQFTPENQRARLVSALVPHFGIAPEDVPPLDFYPHHKTHAAASFYLSPAPEALVITIDGSGDAECTVVWHGKGTELTALHRIEIPHSLGWFYSAITEFLGFAAYDGEYKVMGLAAYGRDNPELREKLAQVLKPGPAGFEYELVPTYTHHGEHTWSERFTDALPELMGMPPRLGEAPLTDIHEDLAFEAQRALEEAVLRLLTHFQQETGIRTLCVGGGVGLNVKMNSRLHGSGLFDEIHAFPVPNDSGLSIGAPVGYEVEHTGKRPAPLEHIYWGPSYTDEEIELQVRSCGLAYRRYDDIAEATAEVLASGKVVGWFQTGLEAGPRALGARSILADPRSVASRDRVNIAIKFREYWRPFCPSMTEEAAAIYLENCTQAPYMILALKATERAKQEVPAIVHVDGTVRAQTVSADTNPRYHALLKSFAAKTGVEVLLNTSFNIKGEAMVCSPRDAIRTFFSTGIDVLSIGSLLIEKPETPLALDPEDVIR